MNKPLYIGLNGFAGSGKDTVARILKIMLSFNWNSLDEFKQYYQEYYQGKVVPATVTSNDESNFCAYAIAFADQLKIICSSIFGIPLDRFYKNKENAWICINQNFEYTEIKPSDDFIITAEDYYNDITSYPYYKEKYWMSLREILVYVGTYVLQKDINRHIFVNVVKNTIREKMATYPNIKYVIVTDIRFCHELDYIKSNNGITITITRNDVNQLDNIAEHDLDDEIGYDYVIENNGTYDELFERVWDIVHSNPEFENHCVQMHTRENVENYLRYIGDKSFKLCTPYPIQHIQRSNGEISIIDPIGGPTITLNEHIPGTNVIPEKIELAENGVDYIIGAY